MMYQHSMKLNCGGRFYQRVYSLHALSIHWIIPIKPTIITILYLKIITEIVIYNGMIFFRYAPKSSAEILKIVH